MRLTRPLSIIIVKAPLDYVLETVKNETWKDIGYFSKFPNLPHILFLGRLRDCLWKSSSATQANWNQNNQNCKLLLAELAAFVCSEFKTEMALIQKISNELNFFLHQRVPNYISGNLLNRSLLIFSILSMKNAYLWWVYLWVFKNVG